MGANVWSAGRRAAHKDFGFFPATFSTRMTCKAITQSHHGLERQPQESGFKHADRRISYGINTIVLRYEFKQGNAIKAYEK